MDDDDDKDDSVVVVFFFACALLCTPSARRALPRCSLFVTIRISHLNLNQIQSPEVFTLGIASQSTRDRRKLFPYASSRDDVDDARRGHAREKVTRLRRRMRCSLLGEFHPGVRLAKSSPHVVIVLSLIHI